jgi:hypothetical protein
MKPSNTPIYLQRRCRRLEVELTPLDSRPLERGTTGNTFAAATSMVNPNLEVSVFPELFMMDVKQRKKSIFDVAEEK